VDQDEEIRIDDSFLIKTLVHNFSHDPETLETFFIRDTVSTHYANIHGSPSDGCYLGPFSTVDLTTMRDCVIGAYSYVQAGEISHLKSIREPSGSASRVISTFMYRYPISQLNNYIYFAGGSPPQGVFMDFVEDRKEAFQRVFNVVNIENPRCGSSQCILGPFRGDQTQNQNWRKCTGRSACLSSKFGARKGCQCPGKLLHHQLQTRGQQCHRPRGQNHRGGYG
jgi:hypothetical protein